MANRRRSPVERLDTRVAAAVGLTAIALLGVLAEGNRHALFRAYEEHTVPTMFSGVLLLLAGMLTMHVSRIRRSRGALLLFAVVLGYMGVDELLTVHEHLEASTGVDWQTLYAPLLLLCAAAWFGVLRLTGWGAPRWLLLGGAAAWVVAQTFELVQWQGDRLVEPRLVLPEELLEMLGSLLFGLAMLAHLRRTAPPDGAAAVAEITVAPVPGAGRAGHA